jgi:hypothetical protein
MRSWPPQRAEIEQQGDAAAPDENQADEQRPDLAHQHQHQDFADQVGLARHLQPIERLIDHGEADQNAGEYGAAHPSHARLPHRPHELRPHRPAPGDRPQRRGDHRGGKAGGERQPAKEL